MNLNIPFLLKLNTDLIVGAIIRNSDAAKQVGRAKAVIAINAALTQINNGDVQNGLAALDAALESNSTILDPAEAAAVQTAIQWITTKLVQLQSLTSGTILGALQTDVFNQVVTEATAVAQKYIPATPAS
jgi:hypothetical protein